MRAAKYLVILFFVTLAVADGWARSKPTDVSKAVGEAVVEGNNSAGGREPVFLALQYLDGVSYDLCRGKGRDEAADG